MRFLGRHDLPLGLGRTIVRLRHDFCGVEFLFGLFMLGEDERERSN